MRPPPVPPVGAGPETKTEGGRPSRMGTPSNSKRPPTSSSSGGAGAIMADWVTASTSVSVACKPKRLGLESHGEKDLVGVLILVLRKATAKQGAPTMMRSARLIMEWRPPRLGSLVYRRFSEFSPKLQVVPTSHSLMRHGNLGKALA